MQFQITVKPGKEDAFEQLLQSWQALGVVVDYALVAEQEETPGGFPTQPLNSATSTKKPANLANDFAFNYRDLVD